MTKAELDDWALKIVEKMLVSRKKEWKLTKEVSSLFSTKDLMRLLLDHDISAVRDHSGCITFNV